MSDAAPAKRNSNDGPVELADDAWCAEKPITTGAWPVVVTKRPGTSAGFKHYGSRRGCCEEPLEICGSIESSDSEETLALEDDWTDTPETGGMLIDWAVPLAILFSIPVFILLVELRLITIRVQGSG